MPEDAENSKAENHTDTCSESSAPPVTDEFLSEMAVGMTLEQIVDVTGEFGHLNELVVVHINKNRGFSSPEAYFKIVQPILDQLAVEIRIRYRPGMNKQEMKCIVQDWIDKEIAQLL
jgi:hypothetical protein